MRIILKSYFKATLELLFVCLMWGSTYTASKIALADISPTYIVGLSYFIAFIILFLLCIKRIKKFNLTILLCGVLIGAIVSSGTILINFGLTYTTATKAGLFNSIEIIIIPIFAFVFLKDKIKLNDIISVIIAVLGIVFINFNGLSFDFGIGDMLCIGGTILYGLQVVVTSKFVKDQDTSLIALSQVFFISVFSLSAGLTLEKFPIHVSALSLWIILYLGVLCYAVGYYLQAKVLKVISSTHTGVIMASIPVFAMLISIITLGESLNLYGIIGAALIILALLNANINLTEVLLKSRKRSMKR